MGTDNKGSHLTKEERKIIAKGIESGATKTAIGRTIGKDNSTIGKEIKQHLKLVSKCPLPLECKNYKHCKLGRECTPECKNYELFTCKRRDRSPGACNGCSNYIKCRFNKYRYDPEMADMEYKETLSDAREGVNLTTSEAKVIGDTVKKLLGQGLSPYTIIQLHPEWGICEKTLYNYIEGGIFEFSGVNCMDLRRQTCRKLPKQSAAKYKKREDRSYLKGRTYADFKAFLSENPYSPVVQMDTVYNDGSHGPFIQTFKFLTFPFFFAVYHDHKTADEMVKGVDCPESILGRTLFDKNVCVLLTDRGTEFSSPESIEKRPDGSCRTRVFFCDPMQSAQKGAVENNHTELRYILPGECDLRALGLTGQEALNLVCSHLNSFPKDKNLGKTNFDCLSFFAHDLFSAFLHSGLSVIPTESVILKPYLLKPFVTK